MKLILTIVGILICIALSFLGIVQLDRFKNIHSVRVETADQNNRLKQSISKVESEISPLKIKVDDLQKTFTELTQSASASNAQDKQLKQEKANLSKRTEQQKLELKNLDESLKGALGAFEEMNLGEGVDIENFSEKVAAVRKSIDENKLKIEEFQALTEAATKKLGDTQKNSSMLTEKEMARTKRVESNSLEASVAAVDEEWGFLLINAGADSGMSLSRPLLVKRNDTLIGKVIPSAIEAKHTIAEINYHTLSPGVRIQPGDRVIFAEALPN